MADGLVDLITVADVNLASFQSYTLRVRCGQTDSNRWADCMGYHAMHSGSEAMHCVSAVVLRIKRGNITNILCTIAVWITLQMSATFLFTLSFFCVVQNLVNRALKAISLID